MFKKAKKTIEKIKREQMERDKEITLKIYEGIADIILKELEKQELAKADLMHDIRRHNGKIDKDYIRDEKGKKVYLTEEQWRKEKGV